MDDEELAVLNETAIEPLIWTTKGNLPTKRLQYKTGWHEDEDRVLFKETYLLNGEVVRESVHVYFKKGQSLGSALGSF